MDLHRSNTHSPTRSPSPTASGFAHQRLDAYHVALELFAGVEELASRFPRGHRDLRDQVRRAAAATVRHIAEGAVLKLGPPDALASLRLSADRVAAMLTGLIRRERRRVEPSA